ncbi:MAG: hypothetical protein E6Q50_03695 [Lysobacter sp.]|nr:MAG: hypothetical protein E6Q50_03695 [Lysobacter sp.]
MRIRSAILVGMLTAALLAGCAAAPPEAPAPDATTKTEAPSAAAVAPAAPAAQPPAPVAPAAPAAQPPAPVASEPAPAAKSEDRVADRAPGFDPNAPNRKCKIDADCAVKDVGNCCGRFPMCVNKDAKTDPAAVQAQCAKDGMASICGFEEVSACQCVQGQCQNLGGGAVVM